MKVNTSSIDSIYYCLCIADFWLCAEELLTWISYSREYLKHMRELINWVISLMHIFILRDGRDGEPGPHGFPGRDGKNGEKGVKGEPGAQGPLDPGVGEPFTSGGVKPLAPM